MKELVLKNVSRTDTVNPDTAPESDIHLRKEPVLGGRWAELDIYLTKKTSRSWLLGPEDVVALHAWLHEFLGYKEEKNDAS